MLFRLLRSLLPSNRKDEDLRAFLMTLELPIERLRKVVEYIDYGERGLAYEIACDLLGDYEVTLNPATYDQLAVWGQAFESDRYDCLKDQVKPSAAL